MSHEEFFVVEKVDSKKIKDSEKVAFVEADDCLGIILFDAKHETHGLVKGFDAKGLTEFIDLLMAQLTRMQAWTTTPQEQPKTKISE
jgi:hypothetical protein